MKGYMKTITVDQRYETEIFNFLYENKIFVNFDCIDGCVLYYFQNPFDYGVTEEFIEDLIKMKEIK